MIQFRFSKKGAKIWQNLPVDFAFTFQFQIYVTLFEKLNFNEQISCFSKTAEKNLKTINNKERLFWKFNQLFVLSS